jgi:hypothetical protein
MGISSCCSYLRYKASVNGDDRVKSALQELSFGFHGKGDCVDEVKESCPVYDLFGSFDGNHKKFRMEILKVSPVKNKYRKEGITGFGNYRRLISHARSSEGTPYLFSEIDVISNFDAIQNIHFYDKNISPIYVILMKKSFEYLNDNDDFNHQLGGFRTNGYGVVNCDFINPFYCGLEVEKYHMNLIKLKEGEVIEKTLEKTKIMEEKDEEWDNYLNENMDLYNEKIEEWKDKFNVDKVKAWSATQKLTQKLNKKQE